MQKAFSVCDRIVAFASVPCCYSKLQVVRDGVSDSYFISDAVRLRMKPLSEGSMLAASCSPELKVSDLTVWRCLLSLLCVRFRLPAIAKVRSSNAKTFKRFFTKKKKCDFSILFDMPAKLCSCKWNRWIE